MKTRMRITRTSPVEALELGFARLADLTGSLVTYSNVGHPEQRDAIAIARDSAAIASDWNRVGDAIRAASRKADTLIARR